MVYYGYIVQICESIQSDVPQRDPACIGVLYSKMAKKST